MKILDRLNPRGPAGPKAPLIEGRLREAERRLAELDAQHGDLALADVLGTADAKGKLAAWQADLDAQRALVARLRAAHGAAKRQDAEAERASRDAIRKTQIRAVAKHLTERDEAGEELSAALQNAVSAFTRMVAASEAAQKATPIGSAWPLGAMTTFGELKRLLEAEMFRLGAGEPGPNRVSYPRAFPGAHSSDLRLSNNPAAIDPLPDALKRASAYALSVIRGEAAGVADPRPIEAPAPSVLAVVRAEDVGIEEDDPSAALEAETLAHGPKTSAAAFVPTRTKLL